MQKEAVSGPEWVFHGEMGDSVRIVEPGAVPCAGALNFVDEACSPESGEGKKNARKKRAHCDTRLWYI